MAILKLEPACKDYLWGGDRLKKEYHKKYSGDILAETWELSCHPDGPSRIRGGKYDGMLLPEYLQKEGKGILGKDCGSFDQFPVLIKFIDAKKNLSVQVHPDDAYALENEHQYGKTEMWYVVDCEEGAVLYYGLNREISEEEFRERIRRNTLVEVLNAVPVHKGDIFFIEPGTIHAIGANILIAEIQQNSNVTYRVYDYGRLGKDGNPRELHIEKAVKVAKRQPIEKIHSCSPHMAKCKYFTVDKLNMDGERVRKVEGEIDGKSFVSVLVLSGKGTLKSGEESLEFEKGDSLFLTAGSGNYEITGCCEALVTTV